MTSDDEVLNTVRSYLVDMDGNPMTLRQWADLYENFPARLLAEEEVIQPNGLRVSVRTVWSGHNEPEMGTLPYGTGVGHDGRWTDTADYSSKEEALAGHARVVAALRACEDLLRKEP